MLSEARDRVQDLHQREAAILDGLRVCNKAMGDLLISRSRNKGLTLEEQQTLNDHEAQRRQFIFQLLLLRKEGWPGIHVTLVVRPGETINPFSSNKIILKVVGNRTAFQAQHATLEDVAFASGTRNSAVAFRDYIGRPDQYEVESPDKSMKRVVHEISLIRYAIDEAQQQRDAGKEQTLLGWDGEKIVTAFHLVLNKEETQGKLLDIQVGYVGGREAPHKIEMRASVKRKPFYIRSLLLARYPEDTRGKMLAAAEVLNVRKYVREN